MCRLSESVLARPLDRVDYQLRFWRDRERRPVAKIQASVSVALRCQRCLEQLEWAVHAETVVAFVAGLDEASRLPDDYEPVVVSADLIRPHELIEDELLLELPQIARHDFDCRSPITSKDSGESLRGTRPFDVLANWKARH